MSHSKKVPQSGSYPGQPFAGHGGHKKLHAQESTVGSPSLLESDPDVVTDVVTDVVSGGGGTGVVVAVVGGGVGKVEDVSRPLVDASAATEVEPASSPI